jgi:hypothetical protein
MGTIERHEAAKKRRKRMTDIANMNLGEIDRLLATTDLSATDVFNALRDHFRANPNRNRPKKWERFFRRNGALFRMVTDDDIRLIQQARRSH